jgi:hypothetical protein
MTPFFNIEPRGGSNCWDFVMINGMRYCGNNQDRRKPNGVVVTPSSPLVWYTDGSVNRRPAWIICSAPGLAALQAAHDSTVSCESGGAAAGHSYVYAAQSQIGVSGQFGADFWVYGDNTVTPIGDCCLTAGTEYELDCFNSKGNGWGAGSISIEGTNLCTGFGTRGSSHGDGEILTTVFRFNPGAVTTSGVHDVCNLLGGDGSTCSGCRDPTANNTDLTATVTNNNFCTYVVGCTDPGAVNYNPNAARDDGSCGACAGYNLTVVEATGSWTQGTISVSTCNGTADGAKNQLLSPLSVRSGSRTPKKCVARAPGNNLTVTFSFGRTSNFQWNNITTAGRLTWRLEDASGVVLSGTGGDAVHQWSTCSANCGGTDLTLHLSDSRADGWDGRWSWQRQTSHVTIAACPATFGAPAPAPFTDPITLGRRGNYTSRNLCLSSGQYIFTYDAASGADHSNHYWWVTTGSTTARPIRTSFDRNYQGWSRSAPGLSGSRANKWLRGRRTPSGSTGANNPPRNGGTNFLYLETSSPSRLGDTNYITSPVFAAGKTSVSFMYHMHGRTMGSLTLQCYNGTGWSDAWSKSGQQQTSQRSAWLAATAIIPSIATRIRFKGVRGSSYTGDMSIDNIEIGNTLIPQQRGTSTDYSVSTCTDCAGGAWPNNNAEMNQCGACGVNLGMYEKANAPATAPSTASLFRKLTRKTCNGAHIYGAQFQDLEEAQAACALDGRCQYVYDFQCSGTRGFRMCTSYGTITNNNRNCVYNQTTTDLTAWKSGTCLGCTDSTASNYDPAATVNGGCNPPTAATIVCNSTQSGIILDNMAGEAARKAYSFSMMPGQRVLFSTCGSVMFTRLTITHPNGTVLQTSTGDISHGFGSWHPGSCPTVPGFVTRPAEILTGVNLCQNATGCTFNIVVSPSSITSTYDYYRGLFNLEMFCAGCTQPTADNFDSNARFDATPSTMCVWSVNTNCVGGWPTCDSSCADITYNISVPQFGGGRHCPFANGQTQACTPGAGLCPNTPNCSLVAFRDHLSWDFRMTDGRMDGWGATQAIIYDCNGTQLLPQPGLPNLTMPATGKLFSFDSDEEGWTQSGKTNTGSRYNARWTPISNFGWHRRTGRTPSYSTGPQSGIGGKAYVFLEVSYQRRGYNATITSPTFAAGAYTTFEFMYHMYGNRMGSLTTQFKIGSTWTTVFSRTGQQNNRWTSAWKRARGAMPARATQMRFVGTHGGHYNGDMSIDEIKLSKGAHVQDHCLPPSSGYTISVRDTPNSLPPLFSIVNPTSNGCKGVRLANHGQCLQNVGRTSDSTTRQSANSNYRDHERCTINITRATTITIGSRVGNARYGLSTERNYDFLYFGTSTSNSYSTVRRATGTRWSGNLRRGSQRVSVSPSMQVKWMADGSRTYSGWKICDLDSVVPDRINWQLLTNTGAVAMEGGRGTSTTCSTCFGHHNFGNTKASFYVPSIDDCNFNSGTCSYSGFGTGGFSFGWKRRSGRTPSFSTGPNSGFGGRGSYAYLETSSGRAGDTSNLTTPVFAGMHSINFKYHMYGATIGTLTVEYTNDGTNWINTGWSKTRQQHNRWTAAWSSASISIPTTAIRAKFVGISRGIFNGDMAIDNVEIVGAPGTQPARVRIAACNGTVLGEVEAFTFGQATTVCLDGAAQTNLVITTLSGSPNWVLNISGFVVSGKDSNGAVNLCPDCAGSMWPRNTAVPNQCGVCQQKDAATCRGVNTRNSTYDFERNYQGWSRSSPGLSGNRANKWVRGRSTPSGSTGPRSTPSGRYFMYLETSSPSRNGDTNYFVSPRFGAGSRTKLDFWYHMHGRTMGKLEVVYRVGNGAWQTTGWSRRGQQQPRWNSAWISAAVYFPPTATQVAFAGTRGSSYTGDMGVDRVVLSHGLASACANKFLGQWETVNNSHCCNGAYMDFRALAQYNQGWGRPADNYRASFVYCNGTGIAGAPLIGLRRDGRNSVGYRNNLRREGRLYYGGKVTEVCLPGVTSFAMSFPSIPRGRPGYNPRVKWDLGARKPMQSYINGTGTCINAARPVNCAGRWSLCDCSSSRARVLAPKQTYTQTRNASINGNLCTTATGNLRSCRVGSSGCRAVRGCTDSTSSNFNSRATNDDGSCLAATTCFGERAAGNKTVIRNSTFEDTSTRNYNRWSEASGQSGSRANRWMRRTGPPGSGSTGPQAAESGRYYWYLETSSPSRNNDWSALQSPTFTAGSYVYVKFAYHMYGRTVNRLKVQYKVGRTWSDGPAASRWFKQGQQHTSRRAAWSWATVLMPRNAVQMRFHATRGGSYTGDSAVDSVQFLGYEFQKLFKRHCSGRTFSGRGYSLNSLSAAQRKCRQTAGCMGVYDSGCNNRGAYTLCRSTRTRPFSYPGYSSGSSCLYIPAQDEKKYDSDLYLSHLADPHNAHNARFIQIYNPTPRSLSLSGYSIGRYTNANNGLTSRATVRLSGTIRSEAKYTICRGINDFNSAYRLNPLVQFRCDRTAHGNRRSTATGGVTDSNGDDTIALMKNNKVIDIFGRPGQDGTNTDAEFEDGEAMRIFPGPTKYYDASHWSIRCDSSRYCPNGRGGNTATPASDAPLAGNIGTFEDPAKKATFENTRGFNRWSRSAPGLSGSRANRWTRRNRAPTSGNTGPARGSDGAYFWYLETSSPSRNGDTNILTSPSWAAGSATYLTFSYHMYGATMGRLRAETCNSGARAYSFERGMEGWTEGSGGNYPSNRRNKWARGRSTPSGSTGATRPGKGSYFMYLETSSPSRNGDISWLISPTFSSSGGTGAPNRVSFMYHMHGRTMGELSVMTKTNGRWSTAKRWSKRGQQHSRQTSGWSTATVTLPARTTQLRFQGTRGSSYTGDMSVDGVTIFNSCSDSSARWTSKWTKRGQQQNRRTAAWKTAGFSVSATDTRIRFKGTRGTSYTGDMAVDAVTLYAGAWQRPWTGLINSGVNWYKKTGRTGSSRTGPNSAASGRYYAYMECSGGRNGDKRNITSSAVPAGRYSHGQFKYHMYGNNMGTLNLFEQLPATDASCGFETGNCGWSGIQGYGGNRWNRRTGRTPSYATGPNGAARGRYYAYLETSWGRTGDNKTLTSPLLASPNRIQFKYHMYGNNIGALYVETSSNNGRTWTQRWSRRGQLQRGWTNAWTQATITVPTSTTHIRFKGQRGNGYNGDIAIDDIHIRDSGVMWFKIWNMTGNKGNSWKTGSFNVNPLATKYRFQGIRGNGWASDMAVDDFRLTRPAIGSFVKPPCPV